MKPRSDYVERWAVVALILWGKRPGRPAPEMVRVPQLNCISTAVFNRWIRTELSDRHLNRTLAVTNIPRGY
jgi:hypothetical protein